MTDSGLTSPPERPAHGDCYSAGERAWMTYGQQLRARICSPWLRQLTRLHVQPDHLTAISLLLGLAFVPLWSVEQYWLAIVSLWLHVLMDGLDGPLARFQHADSPRGSFTDSFCDQLIVSAVIISLMWKSPQISVVAGSCFLVSYTGVLAIAMVRNSLRIPYAWLIRPRFFLYAAIPLQLAGIPNLVPAVVWISAALLMIKLVTGFFNLRRRLEGPATGSAVIADFSPEHAANVSQDA